MTNSKNLARTVATLGQAQLEYKLRDDVQALDLFSGGFLRVLSRTTDAQPGSPANGDAYVMTASASGLAWAGRALNDVAYWLTDTAAWQFATPWEGLCIRVVDEAENYMHDGSDFEPFAASGGYRQVVMESGITPPAPLVNSDGTDWLYSSQTY